MVANERAVTKREVPGGSERLGRGGDPLAPNSGEGFSFCLYPHNPKHATTNKQEWFRKSIPSMCWRIWTSCLGFWLSPLLLNLQELNHIRGYTQREQKGNWLPRQNFTFAYRARILKTPQIPSLSSSRAAADETSSSGSVPAHAWIYIITLLAIPV